MFWCFLSQLIANGLFQLEGKNWSDLPQMYRRKSFYKWSGNEGLFEINTIWKIRRSSEFTAVITVLIIKKIQNKQIFIKIVSSVWLFILGWYHGWRIILNHSTWERILTSVYLERINRRKRKNSRIRWAEVTAFIFASRWILTYLSCICKLSEEGLWNLNKRC